MNLDGPSLPLFGLFDLLLTKLLSGVKEHWSYVANHCRKEEHGRHSKHFI